MKQNIHIQKLKEKMTNTLRIFSFICIAISYSNFYGFCQCPGSATGPNAPTVTAQSGSGTTWTNDSKVLASDDVYATVLIPSLTNSQYIEATKFGFSIPGGNTICGIQVDVEAHQPALQGVSTKDYSVKLIQGGVISGNDNASGCTLSLISDGTCT